MVARKTATATDEQPEETAETGGDDTESVVRRVLGETLGSLFDSGKADVVDTSETKTDPAEKIATHRDLEDLSARLMRQAQDLIKPKASEKKAPEAPKAAAPEVPPQKRNLLREIFWGKE